MRSTFAWIFWPFVVAAGTFATYLGFRSGYPLPVVFLAVNLPMLAIIRRVSVVGQSHPHVLRNVRHPTDVYALRLSLGR